ncbi:hypothetical protein K388_07384 [Streptomyces sp. KhCrAH-43]|uniref:hypothetical protein n=1 Tax=unclassified Streptomyces TaxID=2593676 RepID=UPI00037DFBB0|nr:MULTISPECIES: hypothetical protein [unclassified Streptomyces]MYS36352.1 hypothetical protein [Streptomyces sp. SID4920]MYX64007.1 hypothetical protein [Streptomyces sp. SID8373]RAJ44299.1 hypothetical protein K388_07384 [Streptomyces sp. KhCrAH-43]
MAKSKASKTRTRIDALRAVIDKECTAPTCQESGTCRHEGEKAAARHMLGRLLEKLKDAAGDEREERAQMWAEIYERGYDSNGNTYRRGAKYRSGQSMKERAAGIRADIKMARRVGKTPLVQEGPGLMSQALETYRFDPIGEAPEQIKFRVRIGPGYGSIRIGVDNIPQEWGWIAEEVAGHKGETFTRWRRTQALKDLEAELKSIGEAYNADHGSNSMTDCFASAFFVFVESDDPETLAWRAEYERKRRERRA